MSDKTRNRETLADFVAYCEANPNQRFWQALRNWAGVGFVLLSEDRESMRDTFYREGK